MKGATSRQLLRGGRATGFFRFGLWIGALLLLSGGVYGGAQLSGSPLAQSALQSVVDTMVEATGLLGFTVSDVTVEGRETTDGETILAALAARPGTPILAVSPKRAKQQLESLPWVRTAVIERRLPGTLYVRLVERKPLALWQHGGVIFWALLALLVSIVSPVSQAQIKHIEVRVEGMT